jgi:hypothetical protein
VALSFLVLIGHVVFMARCKPGIWASLASSQACLFLAAGHWLMREHAELMEFRVTGSYDPTMWAEIQAWRIYPAAMIAGIGALILIEGVIRVMVSRNPGDR